MQSFVDPDLREKLSSHDLTVFCSTCSLNIMQLSYLLANPIQLYLIHPVSLLVAVNDFAIITAKFYAKFVKTCRMNGRTIS